jgi:predicted nuclease of restriction endonuclease-like (RecB) superfamily
MSNITILDKQLLNDIRELISSAKSRIALAVNSQMTMLYWNVGKRIREDIIKSERAEYGRQVVISLAKMLTTEYGKGFSRLSLIRMIQFYDSFNDIQISSTLSNQLTWSHIIELLPLKPLEQQEYYAYMAIEENWSVRNLRSNINRMTFERTIANQKPIIPKLLSCNSKLSLMQPDLILKDPYVLDFLCLPNEYYESDLEQAILREIEKFILELGSGFTFMSRQKRISVDEDHFYLDLLFYNRKLKRMVAIELKTGKFKPEYKGQMELYLNYLNEYETYEDELPPIGIILCTEKSNHQIELLNLGKSGIHVAEYWTDLPPKEIFERKIQEIVIRSKEAVGKLTNKKRKKVE